MGVTQRIVWEDGDPEGDGPYFDLKDHKWLKDFWDDFREQSGRGKVSRAYAGDIYDNVYDDPQTRKEWADDLEYENPGVTDGEIEVVDEEIVFSDELESAYQKTLYYHWCRAKRLFEDAVREWQMSSRCSDAG